MHHFKTTFMCPRSIAGMPIDLVRRFWASLLLHVRRFYASLLLHTTSLSHGTWQEALLSAHGFWVGLKPCVSACNTVHWGVVASGEQFARAEAFCQYEYEVRLGAEWRPHLDHLSMDCFYGHAVSLRFCRPVIKSSCQIVLIVFVNCLPKTRRCQRKLVTTRQLSVGNPSTPSQTPSCPEKPH